MTEGEFKTGKTAAKKPRLVALRDFHLFAPPEYDFQIKEGDDLSVIPEKFHANLVTEKVMKG